VTTCRSISSPVMDKDVSSSQSIPSNNLYTWVKRGSVLNPPTCYKSRSYHLLCWTYACTLIWFIVLLWNFSLQTETNWDIHVLLNDTDWKPRGDCPLDFLRWFLGIALRIPTAHDFSVISVKKTILASF